MSTDPIDTARLRAAFVDDGVIGTHWGGCRYSHARCAVAALCDEVERLRARLAGAVTVRPLAWVAAPGGWQWYTNTALGQLVVFSHGQRWSWWSQGKVGTCADLADGQRQAERWYSDRLAAALAPA